MVFKGTPSLIVRLSRVFISRPFKPIFSTRTHPIPKLPEQSKTISNYSTRFYLFSSIYRSFLTPLNGEQFSNLMPFREALNEIKRRLFFVAPGATRFAYGLLGYSLVQQSSNDHCYFDKTLNRIGNLLSKPNLDVKFENENEISKRKSLDDYELGRLLGCGSNAAVYEARLRASDENDFEILSRESSFENDLSLNEAQSEINSNILPAGHFNLAIKMLFNYGIQSNAEALEKAMNKELLPLKESFFHPNVVKMYTSFVDSFPLLNEAQEHYPMAIPTRFSPDGYGRNKTLFIVMKRYDLTLNKYLELNNPNTRERLILFTQLLEALLYLNENSIAHRDLKSDNLLICSSTGELVLTDFGCALHQSPDLKLPYPTNEVSKGGNIALMAPEILNCRAGRNSFLDYNKSDLWASGTLFYEFFSQPNPFYHGSLQSEIYIEKELPSISPLTPPIIERLVYSMLRKNPEKRPSISIVTNCFHLFLWFKSIKSTNELYQSFMWTALETLFNKNTLTRVEFNLKKLFFQRQTFQSLYQAQTFFNQL